MTKNGEEIQNIVERLFHLVDEIDKRRHEELKIMLKGNDLLKAEISMENERSRRVRASLKKWEDDLPEFLARQ